MQAARPARGFTLIEALITVAVIAILSAVALPNYTDYITRSKIIEATTNLSDMRTRLEQYFLDSRQYPRSCICPGGGARSRGEDLSAGQRASISRSLARLTATTYTVTATGNASQGMGGFVYTVDQSNNRKTTSLPSGWSGAGASSTCWINRKSGDC